MSSPSFNLDLVQRWMQEVIVHPSGVAAGLNCASARAAIDLPREQLGQIICPSRRQTSEERLAVYANAYYARLIECLREEFPVFAQAVGDTAFVQFAMQYLQVYPSRSYTLNALGQDFPRFLQETRPAREANGTEIDNWFDMLIDLANLEWTIGEVFDGPGLEHDCRLTRDTLRALPIKQWAEIQLMPSPCLRLLQFRCPVNAYYSQVREGQPPPPVRAEATFLAITRRDYVVRRHPLSESQFQLLNSLLSGGALQASILKVAALHQPDLDRFAEELQTWFQEWTAAWFFQSVLPASSPPFGLQ